VRPTLAIAFALWSLVAALAGCAHYDPKHPALGAPKIDEQKPRYWIWWAGDAWHLRATAAGRPHRFQGTVAGASGSITQLTPTDAALRDRVALAGDAVQFDFDARVGAPGFDLKAAGNCARFDLLLDGKRRPERVRLGSFAVPVARIPFERCP
jgi:hypothetical protein